MRFDDERWSYAILGLIVVLAAYVRLDDLGGAAIAFDEPQHIFGALSYLETGRPVLPSGVVYDRSMFYTWSVAQSIRVFGNHLFAARLPGAMFGVLTVLLTYAFGRLLFNNAVGLVAGFALALLPFEVVWSRTVRMYSAYQFFFLLTLYAIYQGLEVRGDEIRITTLIRRFVAKVPMLGEWELKWEWLIAGALSLWVAVGLHTLGLVIGVSLISYAGILAVGVLVLQGPKDFLRSRYLWLVLVGGVSAFVYLSVPGKLDSILATIAFSPRWLGDTQNAPRYYFDFLTSRGVLPLGVFFIIGSVSIVSRPTRAGLFALVMAVVPLVFHSLAVAAQRPRYIYDIFPMVVLIAALPVTEMFTLQASGLQRWVSARFHASGLQHFFARVGLGAVFLVAFALIWPSFRAGFGVSGADAQNYGGLSRTDWTAACQFLGDQRGNDDVVVATIPLAAEYSGCGRIDFTLDNGEIDQFRPGQDGGLPLHPFSAGPAITNTVELESVLSAGARTWFVVDEGRFNNPNNVPGTVRSLVTEGAHHRWTADDERVSVFEWTGNLPMGADEPPG